MNHTKSFAIAIQAERNQQTMKLGSELEWALSESHMNGPAQKKILRNEIQTNVTNFPEFVFRSCSYKNLLAKVILSKIYLKNLYIYIFTTCLFL